MLSETDRHKDGSHCADRSKCLRAHLMARVEENPGLTLGELKAKLDALTPEQLAMPVIWCGEERGGVVHGFDVLAEDHVDPSGDGMEPISSYATEGDFDPEEFTIVARKGQALLLVD